MNKINEKINILGVNISSAKKEEILFNIEKFLDGEDQHMIFTPNPEIILKAVSNEEYFYILNSADILIPDGIGLKFSSLVQGKYIQRFTGVDLLENILKISENKNKKVLILNMIGGLSTNNDIEKMLLEKFPNLIFLVCHLGIGETVKKEMIDFGADVLFVNFGAPFQEKSVFFNLKKLPTVKIASGVGGAFDFLTGKIRRAPFIIRFFGLEWLWRLFKQPKRITRIYNAVIVFTYFFIRWRFWNSFFYRKNIACLLFKKEGDRYKVLVVKRNNETDDHWQIPQGGTDGEDLKTAGKRELREELNCDKFQPLKTFKNIHKYKFGNDINLQTRHSGFKGQSQGLFIAKFIGEDSDIKINYWDHSDWQWVDVDDLVKKVYPIRREATGKFIEKFKELIYK